MASTLRFDNWEDSNGTPILDGTNLALPSSALPAGSVLQVVSTTYSTSTTIASSSYADTGLSATITPSSASNKILVIVNQPGQCNDDSDLNMITYSQLLRDATSIYEIRSQQRTRGSTSTEKAFYSGSMTVLDSPATTSAVTYKTQAKTDGTSVEFGESGTDCSITLLEVAA